MANDIRGLVGYIRQYECVDSLVAAYGSVANYVRLVWGSSREVSEIVQDRLAGL